MNALEFLDAALRLSNSTREADLRSAVSRANTVPTASDASVTVTPTQLVMILGGLDPTKTRERHRYKSSA